MSDTDIQKTPSNSTLEQVSTQPQRTVSTPETKKENEHLISKAFIQATQNLSFTNREISELLGVSKSTVERLLKREGTLDVKSKTTEIAIIFLRIFRSLNEMFGGNRESSIQWMRTKNKHLGGVPVELIIEIKGLMNVHGYLESVRGTS